MKCTEEDCLAFYVDEATKECKLGGIANSSLLSETGVKAYMKLDDKGNPMTTAMPPLGKTEPILDYKLTY